MSTSVGGGDAFDPNAATQSFILTPKQYLESCVAYHTDGLAQSDDEILRMMDKVSRAEEAVGAAKQALKNAEDRKVAIQGLLDETLAELAKQEEEGN
jgi:hypothetical protein